MKVRFIRLIDKWVGIIACFLLTYFEKLRKRIFPLEKNYIPKKILFLSIAELGALSVAYSAIKRAKINFPQAEIFIFSTKTGEELCEIMGFEERNRIIISSFDNPFKFMTDSIKAVFKLNRIGIDAAVSLEPYLRYSTIMAYLSGSKVRSGFNRFSEEGNYIGNLFTHKLVYNPHFHASLSYVSLIEALKENADDEPKVKRPIDKSTIERYIVPLTLQGEEKILNILKSEHREVNGKKIIIINPNGNDKKDFPLRRWPDDNYVELAKKLLAKYNSIVVLTGSKSEAAHNRDIYNKIGRPNDVINLAGKITIKELLDLYHVSHLLITNDSGPAHFASMTNIPLIVFYGPETPKIFGTLSPHAKIMYKNFACSPCISVYNSKESKCTNNICLKTISVEEVFSFSKEILGE